MRTDRGTRRATRIGDRKAEGLTRVGGRQTGGSMRMGRKARQAEGLEKTGKGFSAVTRMTSRSEKRNWEVRGLKSNQDISTS